MHVNISLTYGNYFIASLALVLEKRSGVNMDKEADLFVKPQL